MNNPVTASELQEILRLHNLWWNNQPEGKRADLSDANLSGADLSSANLRGADLSGADLSGADLRSADLSSADLSGADLSDANLSDANLSSADLRGANLSSADLSSADLRGADLRSADLSGANLSSANGFILIGQDVRGYLFWATQDKGGVVVIIAGCQRLVGISAAKMHWLHRHLGDEILHEDCLSLVDRAGRMARVRGWKLEPVSEPVQEPA